MKLAIESERENMRGSERRESVDEKKKANGIACRIARSRVNELCVSVRKFLTKNGSLELTILGAQKEVNDARAQFT